MLLLIDLCKLIGDAISLLYLVKIRKQTQHFLLCNLTCDISFFEAASHYLDKHTLMNRKNTHDCRKLLLVFANEEELHVDGAPAHVSSFISRL